MIIESIIALLIVSCSSPPKVKTPRGNHRVPINHPSDLAAFEVATDNNDSYRANTIYQDELKSIIVELKKQVTELQQQIKHHTTLSKSNKTTHHPIQTIQPSISTTSTSPQKTKGPITTDPATYSPNRGSARNEFENVVSVQPNVSEENVRQSNQSQKFAPMNFDKEDWLDSREQKQSTSIQKNKKLAKLIKDPKNLVTVRDENVIFTINYGSGKKNFNISRDIKSVLLELAKASESIEVRGYTDSDQDSPADNDIALARAVSAYDFLVMNGIPPNHIYVSYESSGNFIADNATPEGKARNRRVEIEITGTDISYFR